MIRYSLVGRGLAFIGVVIFLFPIVVLSYWIGGNPGEYILQPFDIPILAGFGILGLVMAYSGLIINRRFAVIGPFLTKDGESIHSGKVWTKSSESGLFLTSCRRMVSTNQTSRETAHIGYRVVTASHATCNDCNLREGGAIMDTVRHGRIW
ncbi:MAG: hypothetical protein RTV31_14805 [Candidatus Thorarchaeota archaeon]